MHPSPATRLTWTLRLTVALLVLIVGSYASSFALGRVIGHRGPGALITLHLHGAAWTVLIALASAALLVLALLAMPVAPRPRTGPALAIAAVGLHWLWALGSRWVTTPALAQPDQSLQHWGATLALTGLLVTLTTVALLVVGAVRLHGARAALPPPVTPR